jgi:hypothetical protein
MRPRILRGVLVVVALGALVATSAACGSSSGSAQESAAAPSAVTIGDPVAAVWTDGSFYLATVAEVDGEDVTVTYTDDGSSSTLKASEVRAIPARTFVVGDRVLAVWSKGRFYAGAISAVTGDTYTVTWDDGSTPSLVEATKIIAE